MGFFPESGIMTGNSSPFTIVGIGELLWDLLPEGERPGGAPANFAWHARALGAEVFIVSSVGDDERGRTLVDLLKECGLNTRFISIHPDLPTGVVTVDLDPEGRPDFTIREGVAWDAIPIGDGLLNLAASADAVCFGSLAQRSSPSRETIQQFLAATGYDCLRICDINLRQTCYDETVLRESLALANVLKLNEDELAIVGELLSFGTDEAQAIEGLIEGGSLQMLALTRAERGSLLCTAEQKVGHPGYTREEVADTVGAGDSFTAALTVGLLEGYDLDTISRQANRLAGFVCSKEGAMPEVPEELVSFHRHRSVTTQRDAEEEGS
jgi:fructokinase